jgi:hypothetical protein
METEGIELITGDDGKLHLVKEALRIKKVVGEEYIFNIDEHIINSKEDSEKMKELLSNMVKRWDEITELIKNREKEDIRIEHDEIRVEKRIENLTIEDGDLKELINSLKQDAIAIKILGLKNIKFVGLSFIFQGEHSDGSTIQFTSKLKTMDYDDNFDEEEME